MADKKISALTAASTPLAGTEVLPIVQSGATVKVAVSDLTAGRAVSASQLSSTTKVSAKIATSGTYYRVYEILATGGTAIGEISYSDTNDTMRIANLSNYVNTSMTFYNNGSDRMEIMPNGDVKALNGNVVIGTSGKGITDSTGGLTSTYNSTGITTNGTNSAGQVYRTGTYTDGATTPSVLGVSHLVISNSGATSITNFTNAVNGQIITLIFTDANTTVTRNNAYLSLGLNFTSTANDTLTLIYRGSEALWYEVCRSVNA
jgi:hypothetical protein